MPIALFVLFKRYCSSAQSACLLNASTCTATATTYTHEAALSYAKTQTGWRLPNVKELSSITDKTRSTPAIEVTAFPATRSSGYWSASPYAGDAAYAWFVGFGDGLVLNSNR